MPRSRSDCMTPSELRRLLEQVQADAVNVEDAAAALHEPPVADLGFANVDLHRRQRCGFPEVIFCEGKTPEWIEGVVARLVAANQDCLATRVSAAQADYLAALFPQAEQDRVARTFWLPAANKQPSPPQGKVVVLTAGTSDLPVA